MGYTGFDQFELDCAHSAVVHIRGRNAMSTRMGVRKCYIRDPVHGLGIVERAVLTQNTAVAVRRVFAETYINHDENFGECGADQTNRLNHRSVWIVGGGS